MTYKAAIFDMDGLLLDTEAICLECFLEAGRIVGFEIDLDVYKRCIGSTGETTRRILMEGHGDSFPHDEIDEHWRKLYLEQAIEKPVPLKAGVSELLQRIVEAGTPLSVATSTRHDIALRKLRNAEIIHYFDFVIGGDQVVRGKPAPDIYLASADRHDVPPAHCIAFEDSENGVRAAHGAGMCVVQVPDLVSPSDLLRSLGHTILDSLHEVVWSIK